MSTPPPGADALAATDAWFQRHGLAYFVPERRHQVRQALRPRRLLPLAVLLAVAAAGAGGALAWLADEVALGPAVVVTVALLGAGWYALTALQARPIITWALGLTARGLRQLLPMMTRALPLLLVFATFLFVNGEAWQLAADLTPGALWLTVLLFVLLAVAFLFVRLPEEVDAVDDDVDDDFLLRACAGTPLEGECRALVQAPDADPAAYAEVRGYERWNLVLALVLVQASQVLLLALGVFGFFVVFGVIVMDLDVQSSWTGIAEDDLGRLLGLGQLTLPLVKVSLFLAAFSALYLTVSTVTDDAYRAQFFGSVIRELERAVGVRAVYLCLRERRVLGGDAGR